MEPSALAQGDRVVDLAASLRTAGAVAGAVAAAIALWTVTGSLNWSAGALVAGGVGGFALGLLAARLIYRTPRGQVRVVKLGPGALARTLGANLVGAGIAGPLGAIAPALLVDGCGHLTSLVGLGLAVALVVGGGLGYLASRP
jgi:hypothetical protein